MGADGEAINQGLGEGIFDIQARDVNAIRKQEALHGVKETEEERAFYFDQICREGELLCDWFVDKKWHGRSSPPAPDDGL